MTIDVSVVLPGKNESDNISPLISEVRQAMDGRFNYEVIFVDDGSDDDSLQRLSEIQKNMPNLRVLHHPTNLDQSFAVLNGARRANGSWLVILDSDGQNDPADIPPMLTAAQQRWQADPVQVGLIGHRVNRRDDWLKRLSSKLANGFRDWVLKDNIPDTGCGLKVVRRDIYIALPSFDHMHRYIPALVQALGGEMHPFVVNHRPRMIGQSKYGVWNRLGVGLVDVLGVWWLKRRSKVLAVRELNQ